MDTYVNGIGVVGGFGCGVNDLMECLNAGVSPLYSSSDENSSKESYPAFTADTSCLGDMVSKKALRRIDHFSQLALTGACLAMHDAGIQSLDIHTTGLVLCSGYGSAKTTFSFLDSIIDYGDACASPTLFSNSVHNAAAGHISILLGLEGPCLTVSQFEMSVPSALLSAIQWLREKRAEQVLFGAVDEYCDVIGYCYKRFFGNIGGMRMAPLLPDKQSAVPGEGSVFFLISKEKSATKNYGCIDSVSIGNILDKNSAFLENSFYILNADGHRGCDRYYPELLPQGAIVSCYTPLYGSIPTGQAFDMAIGALSIKEGKFFTSPESVAHLENHHVLRKECQNNTKNISCVKVGRQGELGIITMSKNTGN